MTGPLTPRECVEAFVKCLSGFDREKSPYEKFRDFCEMAFCAIAKTAAPTPQRADELEHRYMQIVDTYRDKDTVRGYPELLALAAQAVIGGCDFLGSAAVRMNALSASLGQFFTPWEVSLMLAKMLLQDAGDLVARNGFVTLSEPASGAGGMVLACAHALEEMGLDPSLNMLVHAVDLSPLCFHMTYLQLSLRGVAGYVQHGDSLSLESFSGAWTPAAFDFYRHHGRLFPDPPPTEQEPMPDLPGKQLRLF